VTDTSVLLQLVSLSARRNFSHDLDADYVASVRRGWSTAPLAAGGGAPAGGVETPWRPARYHFSTGVSASEHSERSTEEWGFRPSQLRQLGLLAYLSRLSTSPPSGTCSANRIRPHSSSNIALFLARLCRPKDTRKIL